MVSCRHGVGVEVCVGVCDAVGVCVDVGSGDGDGVGVEVLILGLLLKDCRDCAIGPRLRLSPPFGGSFWSSFGRGVGTTRGAFCN